MAKKGFDYQGALAEGYTDEEITPFLVEKYPQFDYQAAQSEGYSPQEINEYLSTYKPEKSKLEKAGRTVLQYGLGAAQGSVPGLVYEAAVAPLASKEAQTVPYRQNLFEDIERLSEQKQTGIWDEQDENLLQNLLEQAKDTSKSEEFIQTADLGLRNLAEKATGMDLEPEGIAEKAAQWAGFIRNPRGLLKGGVTPKEFTKALFPTGKEALRGLGAGAALEIAEDGNYGPIGTMAAAVVGDLAGAGLGGLAKTGVNFVKQPKKTLAELATKFTPKDKLAMQKDIIKDFRDAGIQADLGTITDSNLIKWTQSRLAQSGLTGKALDEFRSNLTNQIKEEYKVLAESLGEARFATNHEAGEVVKNGLKSIRDADLAETRNLYDSANKALKENSFVNAERVGNAIKRIEKELTPGQVKSTDQQSVLKILENLKRDVFDSEGNLMYSNVKDLMNNKIALNDIINYEVQGGTKQLLKGVVAELDRAIISHGKQNPTFAKNYINANRRFSAHAKTFRNKNVASLLSEGDPAQVMNKMNSVHGIRQISDILSKSLQGNKILGDLRRLKLDQVIGNNMVDSTTQQVKLGTFSKLLEKGKNREIIKEILGAQAFKRLERLQKNSGRLADAAQKFYNASQSGVVAADMIVYSKAVGDIASILAGNPWPLLKTGGGLLAARKLSNLLADPEFLKLAEEAILASKKGSQKDLINVFERLKPIMNPYLQESNES